MKGKWFLALLLISFLAVLPVRAAETSFDLREAGVGFDLPEELQGLKGVIQPNYGVEVKSGSGVFVSALTYCAMSEEKYDELVEKGADLTDEDREFISPRLLGAAQIYGIDKGRSLADLNIALSAFGLSAEGYEPLGSAGEYNFFYRVGGGSAAAESSGRIFDEEVFREEYDALIAAFEDPSWIRLYEPERMAEPEDDSLRFETTDLDGNTVNSEEIFSGNRITMVNIWGTFCGPCINEMPDLEVLNGRLGDKGCGIIGIVCDVNGPDDTELIETAKEIIADTGVTYLNLLPWDSFWAELPAQFIPTTYFVDADGQILGEPAVGARGADDYEMLLDDLLEEYGLTEGSEG